MITNKYLFVLIVSLAIYTVPELFFDNAMLYITGGVIVGSIVEIFDVFGHELLDIYAILIWLLLFVGAVSLYLRLRNKYVKYLTLIVVVFLMYVFDFLSFEILPISVTNNTSFKWIRILAKGFFLSMIIYQGLLDTKSKGNVNEIN